MTAHISYIYSREPDEATDGAHGYETLWCVRSNSSTLSIDGVEETRTLDQGYEFARIKARAACQVLDAVERLNDVGDGNSDEVRAAWEAVANRTRLVTI